MAAEVQRVILPDLYPKQRAAFYCPERVSVCEASTKAGKSVGGLHWEVSEGLEDQQESSALWLEPIYPQAKIMHHRLKRWMTKADPARRVWDARDGDELSVRVGRCTIHFKGSDNPDSIYGPDYKRAVIDEASRVKEEAWYAVRSTLTATSGRLRIIGNVKGRKNWAYRMARRAESGEPGMAYHKITAADAVAAGVLKQDDIDAARRDLPEQVFRELYYAEPTEDGSNPFGLPHIRACVKPLSAKPPVKFGIDLAKSVDWTWVVGLDQNGDTCISERWQGESWERTTNRIAGIVGDKPGHVDSTGVGDPIMERLSKVCPALEGFKYSGGANGSKQRLMENLAVMIQAHNLGFPEGILTSELESFEYEPQRIGCLYSAPDGMTDDGVNALALAAWEFEVQRDGGGVYVGALGDLRDGVDLNQFDEAETAW